MKCEELTQIELEYVSGGFRNFMIGYLVSKAMDSYVDWVQGGAGGWKVEYNGIGYDDPLL
ncbi:hypothetical protein KUL156_63110 [Alteromonas sp. KUL156]|nr:hypothetical protein KUL154_13490 [Alteromonas sp. KUL154]GFE03719.1 hypothetical protein KUL156_63110 [Alteromonas sp. KUL156]